MARRWLIPVLFALVAASSLCAGQRPGQQSERQPLTLCIVQTTPDEGTHYDPSAGPWAIAAYNQLAGKNLRNGARLKITVLPASVEKDILPEVRRLECARVVQLWYEHSVYMDGLISGSGPGNHVVMKPEPRYENTLFYSLWDGATQKILGRGSVPLSWRSDTGEAAPNAAACGTLAKQTLKWMNRMH